jgi:hypothetical protein
MSGTTAKAPLVRSPARDRAELRSRIIEADVLRRALARDDEIRQRDPGSLCGSMPKSVLVAAEAA